MQISIGEQSFLCSPKCCHHAVCQVLNTECQYDHFLASGKMINFAGNRFV